MDLATDRRRPLSVLDLLNRPRVMLMSPAVETSIQVGTPRPCPWSSSRRTCTSCLCSSTLDRISSSDTTRRRSVTKADAGAHKRELRQLLPIRVPLAPFVELGLGAHLPQELDRVRLLVASSVVVMELPGGAGGGPWWSRRGSSFCCSAVPSVAAAAAPRRARRRRRALPAATAGDGAFAFASALRPVHSRESAPHGVSGV